MRLTQTIRGSLLAIAVCLAVIPGVLAQEMPPKVDVVINKADLPLVAIVTTGGTIAEKTDPKTGAAVPAVSGKDLVAAVPGLKEL